jgi:phage terminase large subunit GpA-like protein
MTREEFATAETSHGPPSEWNDGIDNLDRIVEYGLRERPVISVSQYAENNRVLPSETPFPGAWQNSRTPYLREIMDNLSAYSPIQRTIVVKGTQLGLTTAAENALGYWMDVSPTKILFVSATQELLEIWSSTRLEKLIDSCGLRERIFSQTETKHSKKTGDRTFRKEFFGGYLALASAQSSPSLRSADIRVLFRDEIDGAPRMLRTGEGNWLEVSLARTDSWGERKKIFDFSTPTTLEESSIWPEYESGDQRRFFVPCLRCGVLQVLEFGHGFGHENPAHGLQWELRDGQIRKSWYVCPHCGGEMRNHEKNRILSSGEWRPTSSSYSDRVRSYQLSSLYSPAGMLSWDDIALAFLKAQEGGPDAMRSFVTLRLGLPFRETGARPDWRKVIELRGNYHAGTVPTPGPIFLTASVDVQRGSEKRAEDGAPRRSARLEWEVCAHGIGYRTWSIEHRVFEGATDDPFSGAWTKIEEYWKETRMTYRDAAGRAFPLRAVFVDSGDGPHADTVYAFVARWNAVWASKGMATIKRRRGEAVDDDVNRSIRRFRVAKLDADKPLIEINGPFYKQRIYSALKIQRKVDSVSQPANFCDFPFEYGEEFFLQLTAEEMVTENGVVTFKKSSARPNEALDLRVMNLAAADFVLDQLVLTLRGAEKARGVSPEKVAAINSRTALEYLARQGAAAR